MFYNSYLIIDFRAIFFNPIPDILIFHIARGNIMADKDNETKPSSKWKVIGVVAVIIGIGLFIYLIYINSLPIGRDDDVSLSRVQSESQENTIVLFFWGAGCAPCTEQKPIISDLENDYKNSNVTFYWFDISKHKDLTDHYNVDAVPTTIVIDKSGVVDKFRGTTSYDSIADSIEEAILSYV